MEEQPKYQAGMKVKHQSGFTGIIIGEPKYFGETYMYAVRNEFREYEFPEGELTIADKPEPYFKAGDNVIYTLTSKKLRIIEIVDYDEYDTIDGVNQFCWYYLASNADNMKLIVAGAFLEPATVNQDEEIAALDRSIEIGYLNHRGEHRIRRIIPENIWHGKSEYYERDQWFITALDLEKKETRDFALENIFLPVPKAQNGVNAHE